MKVTIFTPTYNRAAKLLRLYESLLKQSSYDFEWIIVDDGSCDNTKEIVSQFHNKEMFSMQYIFQENGGKHRAYNKAIEFAKGDYFFCVDSDDYLERDAVLKIIECTENMDSEQGIIAYKINETGKRLSNQFPKEVNISTRFQLETEYGCKGEFTLIYPTKLARENPFPTFPNEKFMTESVIYDRMEQKCTMKILADVLTICEYLPDGYSSNSNAIMKSNPGGYCLYYMQRITRVIIWEKIYFSLKCQFL